MLKPQWQKMASVSQGRYLTLTCALRHVCPLIILSPDRSCLFSHCCPLCTHTPPHLPSSSSSLVAPGRPPCSSHSMVSHWSSSQNGKEVQFGMWQLIPVDQLHSALPVLIPQPAQGGAVPTTTGGFHAFLMEKLKGWGTSTKASDFRDPWHLIPSQRHCPQVVKIREWTHWKIGQLLCCNVQRFQHRCMLDVPRGNLVPE